MGPYKRSVRVAYAIVTSGKPAYKPKWPKPNWENRVPHFSLGAKPKWEGPKPKWEDPKPKWGRLREA